jgi:hypothetical protein
MAKTLIVPETVHNPLIHKRGNKTPVNTNSVNAFTPETDYKVRGHFINIEYPGLPQKICGKYYRGMQYFDKILNDGETVEIPLSVATWINQEFSSEQATYLQDEKGNPLKSGKKIARGKFIIEEHLK